MRCVGCEFDANGVEGSYDIDVNSFIYCLFRDNSSDNVESLGASTFVNCVSHNAGGNNFILNDTGLSVAVGCRGTLAGIDNFRGATSQSAAYTAAMLYCYAQANSGVGVNSVEQISLFGSDTNIASGIDSDYGYTDSSTDDYNIADGSTLDSVALTLQ
jgi:hypothetical protein